MYENSKQFIICPICGARVEKFQGFHYVCNKCGWDSLENTIDIYSKDPLSSPLSNLFPHMFIFYPDYKNPVQHVECASMESFLQSLRVKEPMLQIQICKGYAGLNAWKLRGCLNDWRKDGIVYWDGKPIVRVSKEYTNLITRAYDCLFHGNAVFRELVLPRFKDSILIHSIGHDDPNETLLTELEYRHQLNRLIKKL